MIAICWLEFAVGTDDYSDMTFGEVYLHSGITCHAS